MYFYSFIPFEPRGCVRKQPAFVIIGYLALCLMRKADQLAADLRRRHILRCSQVEHERAGHGVNLLDVHRPNCLVVFATVTD